MTYTVNYDIISGKPISIQNGNSCIPITEQNRDFREFLEWNSEQDIPLDHETSIEVTQPEIKTEEIFSLPVIAPDFIVRSPKPKAKHLEAHLEAIEESKKPNKSIALIVLDLVVYIDELEKRMKALEKK